MQLVVAVETCEAYKEGESADVLAPRQGFD